MPIILVKFSECPIIWSTLNGADFTNFSYTHSILLTHNTTAVLMYVGDCEWLSGASSSSGKERNVPYSMLRPTYTHEALCKLVSLGILKHLISQNTDGLHRLSGIPRDRLSELHGNAFHERCEKCGTKYERLFVACTYGTAVPEQVCVHCHCSHRTGRICERKVSMLLIWRHTFTHFTSCYIFWPLYWQSSAELIGCKPSLEGYWDPKIPGHSTNSF